jgi:NAD+-dependent secondary alcohol dehydrogenase Adh1
VDRSPAALELAKQLGSDYTIIADGTALEQILGLTHGKGAEAVIDFVGEGNSISEGFAMTRNAGYYYVVGYGGELRIPTMELITTEKTIVGNLVGTYAELVELMDLADRGLVHLATQEYRLADANQALQDLKAAKVRGRAVLVP